MTAEPAPGGTGETQPGRIDVDRVCDTMTTAFLADPFMVRAFPDPVVRRRCLAMIYRGLIAMGLARGDIETLADDAAVAIWHTDTSYRVAFADLWSQYRGMPRAAGLRATARLWRMSGWLEGTHRSWVSGPHAHLQVLAVHPDRQGRGLGSTLLGRGLARVDAAGQRTYLETHLERNARLYRRFGFELVGQSRDWGIDTYGMLRPARR